MEAATTPSIFWLLAVETVIKFGLWWVIVYWALRTLYERVMGSRPAGRGRVFVGVAALLLCVSLATTVAEYLGDIGTDYLIQNTTPIHLETRVVLWTRVPYYLAAPERGDPGVMKPEHLANMPANWRTDLPATLHYRRQYLTVIQRVVGLPGERISMQSDGSLLVNGARLEERYTIRGAGPLESHDIELRAGEYLVANDHRGTDLPSGEKPYYVVYITQIIGREVFVFWPYRVWGVATRPVRSPT